MKRTLRFVIGLTVLLGAGLLLEPASAQIQISSLPGGVYSQNFNSLAISGANNPWQDNATLPGWYAGKSNKGTPDGFAKYTAGTGSDNAGALYSFGATGSPERALGSLASGNANVGNIAYGVRFANDTGTDIASITITYTGEQWRNGGNITAQTLACSCRVSADPITSPDPTNADTWTPLTALDFISPTVGGGASAVNGNDAAHRQEFTDILLTGVVLPAGAELFLRWRDIDDTGNDHAMAIDDLSVTFSSGTISTSAPTYATVALSAPTNQAGATVLLIATSDGSPSQSLTYQWRKDGAALSDAGNLSGSTTPTLTLTNVLAADAGDYDVIVANSAGAATSAVATVTVLDPAIQSQSADRTCQEGTNVTFTVTARGTPTLIYQWFFGGAPIAGATRSALTLTNLQTTHQGAYTCWVTNGLGDYVASAPIQLTVTRFPSVTLALWDFNDTNAPVASPTPSLGAGTAALLGGVKATYAAGVSSDPRPTGTNQAWNTSSYPSQGSGNKTAGVQFNVSTLGYQNIYLSWSQRHSNTGSKYTRLQYSADGETFSDLDFNTMTNGETFVSLACDLATWPAAHNNPNFAFRIVTEFESPANPNYVGTEGTYSPAGTIRFDMVRVYGDPIGPETVAPVTISHLQGTTLSYGGGGGAQFVLLEASDVAAPLGSWARVQTNFTTPGTFTIPAVGAAPAKYYRIQSE